MIQLILTLLLLTIMTALFALLVVPFFSAGAGYWTGYAGGVCATLIAQGVASIWLWQTGGPIDA